MLINYKATRKLIAAHQPIELLVGGDFSSSDGWTLDGWTIDTALGKANHVTSTTVDILRRDILTQNLLSYTVSYELSGVTAGAVLQKIAGTFGLTRDADGLYSEEIVAGSATTDRYGVSASADFVGSIKNISVMLAENFYDIDFEAGESLEVFSTKKETPTSDDNTSQTIVVNSEIVEFNIKTDYILIGSSKHFQFIEFFASVREGEQFTFDEFGFIGASVDPIHVKIIGRESKTKETNNYVTYSFSVMKV